MRVLARPIAVVTCDGQPCLRSYMVDISARRRTEQALRDSEQRYRALVESAEEAIFQVDPDGQFLFLNTTAAERLGGCPEQFIGKHMTDLFPPQTAERQLASVQQVIRTGRGIVVESETVLQGECRFYRTTIQPVRSEKGPARSALAVARDITDHRRADEALQRAHEQLTAAREDERRQLARDLHDSLGQGLIALQLALDAAVGTGPAEQPPRPGQQRPGREAHEAARVSSASADGPDKAPGETSDPPPRAEPADPPPGVEGADLAPAAGASDLAPAARLCRELIGQVRHLCHGLYPPTLESLGLGASLEQLAGYCRDAGLAATVQSVGVPPGDRLGESVEIALFRIAQEAASNVVKHSGARAVSLRLSLPDGKARLEVTDDGAGFDPDQPDLAGLGLRTMHDRAMMLGGELTVTSRPGRTVVAAEVPLSGPGRRSPADGPGGIPPGGGAS
jgi:PAS domain S-box-containing protein